MRRATRGVTGSGPDAGCRARPGPATSPPEHAMKIDKQQIMGFLQDKGENQKAQQADRELPQQVDTEKSEDANLLQRLGIDPMALAKQFMGDKGIPGL
jgi:hypothetical protein